jgi:predicted GNAT family acetyltransferase
MADTVTDNAALGRFELARDGGVVFATYRREGKTLVIRHVEAPPALRGTGAAGLLMQGIMQIARAEGARVLPLCGYASAWNRRHRDYHDLVA